MGLLFWSRQVSGACMVIGIVCLANCSTNQTRASKLAAPSVVHPVKEPWHLTFHLSGGFAGFDRELALESTGELSATDRKRGTHATIQASGEELAQIESIVKNIEAAEPGRGADCRDCLLYDLQVLVNGRSFVWRLNDVSVAGTSLEPLVKVLSRLLDRALAEGGR